MRFAIQIQDALPGSLAAHSALAFARALLAAGHELHRVFFYNDGVTLANELIVLAQDETDIAAQWRTLAETHHFELAVCVANAQRRGVLDQAERKRYEKSATSVAAGFTVVGLGELIEASQSADRFITFPAAR